MSYAEFGMIRSDEGCVREYAAVLAPLYVVEKWRWHKERCTPNAALIESVIHGLVESLQECDEGDSIETGGLRIEKLNHGSRLLIDDRLARHIGATPDGNQESPRR